MPERGRTRLAMALQNRRGARWVVAPAILLATLSQGCFSTQVHRASRTSNRRVPVTVRVHSDPPGAQVTDLVTGERLGVTPIEHEALVLEFEAWSVINDPEAEGELLGGDGRDRPDDESGTYAVLSPPGGSELERGAARGLTLRYRLELAGYEPTVLTHTIPPETLPALERSPVLVLEAELVPRAPR